MILERSDVKGITELFANRLSVEMRLLHHILGRILFSKTGRFDFISERDIVIMYYLIQGVPLNLPSLILTQMRDEVGRAKMCLPYGMTLTSVFREVGVSFEDEVTHGLIYSDTYSERSLHRMGYRKSDGRWTRRLSGQVR